jgi:hypothetical protein
MMHMFGNEKRFSLELVQLQNMVVDGPGPINGSKEAVDLIKAGDMVASGDYNGLVKGCLGAEIASESSEIPHRASRWLSAVPLVTRREW